MIRVQASPNIAFIKYWGKKESTKDHDRNIGANPSVSMTLDRAKTTVEISSSPSLKSHKFLINKDMANKTDEQKILAHVARIEDHFKRSHPKGAGHLVIHSENNFPASAGMASSASAFAALTIGICAAVIGKEATRELMRHHPEVISMLARRGSGSAARSVKGGYMKWDTTHATALDVEWPLLNTIVILSNKTKDVSSSEGHRRALTSPLFAERQLALPARTEALTKALKSRDLKSLGALLETEALEMHAIARSSTPPTEYLSAETKKLIDAIQALPERNFYFTIDAGPNLHLISETPISEPLSSILASTKIAAEIWQDTLGTGPTLE